VTQVLRPALRYHGGKWRLAPKIIAVLPPHEVYVEPYAGGASVLLRKPRARHEVYNDLSGEVANVFRVLRDQGEALRRACRLTPFSREEYYRSFEPTEDPVEQARRTMVKSFMGHGSNSIRKSVASGFRSKAHGAMDWMRLPNKMPGLLERLQGVVIENRPALEVMKQHDGPRTLFYVDPPYPRSTRSQNGHGRCACCSYEHEMSDEEHQALLLALVALKGAVAVSCYACPLYDSALAGWERHELAAWADKGKRTTEVLWVNRARRQETLPL